MAIYHCTVKVIGRSSGKSVVAAAAYRSGERIKNERDGEVHDYREKSGIEHKEIILPEGGTAERAAFWNSIEQHHKRKDAVLAREIEVALPNELTKTEQKTLAVGYARELADTYRVGVDIAIHDKQDGNPHAHILLSACHVSKEGTPGAKAVELDPIHCQRHGLPNLADHEREKWEQKANTALEHCGTRIDHRSLKNQGIDRVPQVHLGPVKHMLQNADRMQLFEKIEKINAWSREHGQDGHSGITAADSRTSDTAGNTSGRSTGSGKSWEFSGTSADPIDSSHRKDTDRPTVWNFGTTDATAASSRSAAQNDNDSRGITKETDRSSGLGNSENSSSRQPEQRSAGAESQPDVGNHEKTHPEHPSPGTSDGANLAAILKLADNPAVGAHRAIDTRPDERKPAQTEPEQKQPTRGFEFDR